MNENKAVNRILLSVKELSENDEYVLVKFKEYVNNRVVETVEKGLKDEEGDIREFIPYVS